MVAQEGFMTNLVFGKGYIQYAFLGHAISILPRVETDIPDLVPSQNYIFQDPPFAVPPKQNCHWLTLPVQVNMKW